MRAAPTFARQLAQVVLNYCLSFVSARLFRYDDAVSSLHEHLKESTRRVHEHAEANQFQGSLAQGKLPFETYKLYLAQLAHLHDRFERMLKDAAVHDKWVGAVVDDDCYQLPFLQSDLKALNQPLTEAALPSIDSFLADSQFQKHPVALIGALYVLLGSKHGGKFIARNVKQAYGLNDAGYSYFDPFGDRFRSVWTGFTSRLNQLPDDELIRTSALQGALDTFNVFVSIGDELWRRRQPASV